MSTTCVLVDGALDVDVASDPEGDARAEAMDLLDHGRCVRVLVRVENEAVIARLPPVDQ